MKKILFISFIIITLYSCSVSENLEKINTSTDFLTTTQINKLGKEIKLDITEDGMVLDETQMLDTVQLMTDERHSEASRIEIPNIKIDIDNKVDTTLIKSNDIGIIAYNVPKKFKVNEYSTIKLRISKSDDAIAIVGGNRGISIIGKNSKDKVILESIKIDDIMTAILYSDNDSAIIELVNKNETQNIHKNGYTEWIWRIKPLNDKPNYLKLIVSISGRDIVVYEKTIPVDGDFWFESTSWLEKWWEVLATTLIIPIVIPIFIYYKRKSNKERS
jgi:hypothetical protein